MENTKLIEINGVKMEVDLRTAKVQTVDTFKVGDIVKLLYRAYESATPEVKTGMIVAFDNFKNMPSISIAYIDSTEVKFATINEKSLHEMVGASPQDLSFDKSWILRKMDEAIATAADRLDSVKRQKELFNKYFGQPMPQGDENVQNATAN